MTLLPIVQREMLVASRRPFVHWMRFLVAGGMVLFTALILYSNRTTLRPDLLAQSLFLVIAAIAFAYALLAGVLHTADNLGAERREGTLGLLFLTDLQGYDVVLGKFVAASVHSFFALVATLPVLAMPMMLGGVTVGQFWRTTIALLVTLFLSLATGALWSSFARDTRQAVVGTLLTIVGLLGATFLTEWMVRKGTRRAHPWMLAPSPMQAYRLGITDIRTAPGAAGEFRQSVRTQLGLGVGALVAASIVLGRSWRSQLERHGDAPVETVVSWSADDPRLYIGWRHVRWQHWLDQNPYYWLARVTRPPDALLRWLMIPGSALSVALLVSSLAGPQIARDKFALAGLAVAFAMHLGIKIVGALASTRSMNEDRNSGALELMMVCGLKPEEIIRGQRQALQRQFLPSEVILTALNLLLLTRVNLPLDPIAAGLRGVLNFGLLTGTALLWLDLRTLFVIGIQRTLRSPNPLHATRGAVLRVLFVPWIGAALLVGIALADTSARVIGSFGMFWFLACVLGNAYALSKADLDLKEGFRLLAAGLHFDRGDAQVKRAFRNAAEYSFYGR